MLAVFGLSDPRGAAWKLGLPFSVLLGTPFAVFGAYLGLYLARLLIGESYVNNVFAQIGLIMLIGLAAKNAILIVEFAKVEVEKASRLVESALLAAKLRLADSDDRLAFILGVVPLLTASGAGAEARKVMGMTVFAGMLVATILGVLLISMLFVAVERDGPIGAHATIPTTPRPAPGHELEPTEMARSRARLLVVISAAAGATLVSGCTMGANYARPAVPTPADTGSCRPHRPSPWPTCRGGRSSTIPCCITALIEMIGQPRSPGRGRAGRGSPRARRHRPIVPVSAGQFRRKLRRQAGDQR